MKRQWELLKQSPVRAFLAVSLGLPLFTLIGTILTWTPLPLKGWFTILQAGTLLGGLVAAAMYLKKSSPHLDGSGILALLLQVMVALMIMWIPIAHLLGIIEPQHGAISAWVLFPIGAVGLMAAWGIIRDFWWAYFLEAGIILGIVGLVVWIPGKPGPQELEMFPSANWFMLFGYVFLFFNGMFFPAE